jgi:hypothetical protein
MMAQEMLRYVSPWHCKRLPQAMLGFVGEGNGLKGRLAPPDLSVSLKRSNQLTGTMANFGQINGLKEDTGQWTRSSECL